MTTPVAERTEEQSEAPVLPAWRTEVGRRNSNPDAGANARCSVWIQCPVDGKLLDEQSGYANWSKYEQKGSWDKQQ